VQILSSAVIELALQASCPIVPVRFSGGLPVEAAPQRLEFPFQCARQSVWIGAPIAPDALQALGLKERKQLILEEMNSLGPAVEDERPNAAHLALAEAARAWSQRTGASAEHAMLLAALQSSPVASSGMARLLEATSSWRLVLSDTPAERWLAQLASRLFGPRGPAIELG
jgi:hypothetical protein